MLFHSICSIFHYKIPHEKEPAMAESMSIRLQPQTVETVEKIIDKRISEGIKDSKTRIVAEAVAQLGQRELKNG